MRTLLIFGDGATSSSESHVSSALGVLSPGDWEAGFWREVGVSAGSFPVGGSGGHERTRSSGSQIDAALEVVQIARDVVRPVSNIIHSEGEDGRARDFYQPKFHILEFVLVRVVGCN